MRTKILAVDDEEMYLLILSEIFSENFEFKATSDPKLALPLIEEFRPSIILLDIMMPDISGLDICRMIRQNPAYDMMKVILFSGKTQVNDRLRGYEAGANDYITKPFDPTELEAKIKVYAHICALEKSLLDHKMNLEQKVKERTEELLKSQKLADLGTNTAEIIHNLKNPLSLVKCLVHRITLDNPNDENIKLLNSGIEKLQDIIKSILLDSRSINALYLEEVDINETIQSEVAALDLSRQDQSQIYKIFNLGFLPKAKMIPIHLSQVLGNLLKNSYDAMHGCPIKSLTIDSIHNGDKIIIKIKDTGCGIKKENLSKIFEPFFTTKPTLSYNEPTGTGLGLSSVKKMIDSYGGSITVDSELGKGTTFTVTLPTLPTKPNRSA